MADSNQSLTAEEQIKQLEEILDLYDIKWLKTKVNPEADQYLGLNYEQLEKISKEECKIACVILSEYSRNLQAESNRQRAKKEWAEVMIDRTIADEIASKAGGKGTYQSFEEKKLIATQGNSYTKKLHAIMMQAQSRMNELYGMAQKLDLYINHIASLKY